MIRIALTKGRIEESFIKLLRKSGYNVNELLDKGRRLIFKIDTDIEVVLAKAGDVITYIEHGVCDIGIVGLDTIMEQGQAFYEVLDLRFGKCRFALAGITGKDFFAGYSRKTVATKYPNVTKKYLGEKGCDAEIVKIDGSVELAPLLGLADAIVDIVETGSTLKENGLCVYEDIVNISTRMIANVASMKLKKHEIQRFTERIGAVL